MRLTARWRAWAAHHRVHVGIVFALAYVAFSRPSAQTFWYGALLVVVGESIRVWACGHLVRNEELTRDGPYSIVRHPLYLGSLLIGLGLMWRNCDYSRSSEPSTSSTWMRYRASFLGLAAATPGTNPAGRRPDFRVRRADAIARYAPWRSCSCYWSCST